MPSLKSCTVYHPWSCANVLSKYKQKKIKLRTKQKLFLALQSNYVINSMACPLEGDSVHSALSEVLCKREVFGMAERKLDLESRDTRLHLGSELLIV